MPGYNTREHNVRIGEQSYRIRGLSDLQQFADPDHRAERAGISSAQWSLFGHLWPAGQVLAEAMDRHDVAGKRILELGCGLGLSSLVLQQRGAMIVASDHHPLAESFLAYNSALNGLPSVSYRELRWDVPHTTLGLFDLVIGSDILYESGHAAQLAMLLARHTHQHSEVLITDPGRGNSAPFTRAMAALGFVVTQKSSRMNERDVAPFRGRLLSYSRGTAPPESASVPAEAPARRPSS